MKEIQLTQGQVALVDDEDFEKVNQFKWHANRIKCRLEDEFYASRKIRVGNRQTTVNMHNFILGELYVDHKDHNKLNNQRLNLRKCTVSQNGMNRRPDLVSISKYKGVDYTKQKTWRSRIAINKKRINLGVFKTEIEAAKAYDKKAKELFGEFACLNFK